ncbi:MAG: CDP-alcohol phosphatidyltransferase family protein [Candidatus Paceibacterota bacterium]
MLDTKRHLFKGLEGFVANTFAKLPLSANQYTYLSIVFVLISAYLIISREFYWALAFFALSGLMDFVDGSVARAKGTSGPFGAYLDTVVDRYIEGIIIVSLMFLPLPHFLNIPHYIWIGAFLFGSIATTYVKAAASEKKLVDRELVGGVMSRGERIIMLCIGILLANFSYTWCMYVIVFLAIMSNYTALQRITSAFRKSKTILSA